MSAARIKLIAKVAQIRAQQESDLLGQAYRALASEAHPDHGGDATTMQALNAERERLTAKRPEPTKPKEPVAPPRAIEIQPAADAFNTWAFSTEAALETVLDPCWLGAVAKTKQMRAGDRVIATHARHEYLAELLIVGIDADAQALVYKPLSISDLSQTARIGPDYASATVADEGAEKGFAVRLNGRIVKIFPEQGLAEAWLRLKKDGH